MCQHYRLTFLFSSPESKDDSFFQSFSIVVLCNQPPTTATRVSLACRQAGVPCVIAGPSFLKYLTGSYPSSTGTHGGYCYAYFDVANYSYVEKGSDCIKTESTASFSLSLESSWKDLPEHRYAFLDWGPTILIAKLGERGHPPSCTLSMCYGNINQKTGHLPSKDDAFALVAIKRELCAKKVLGSRLVNVFDNPCLLKRRARINLLGFPDQLMVDIANSAHNEMTVAGAVAGGVISQGEITSNSSLTNCTTSHNRGTQNHQHSEWAYVWFIPLL